MQLEDAEERAKQEAAKNFVGTSTAPARHAGSRQSTTNNNDDDDGQESDNEDVRPHAALSASDL